MVYDLLDGRERIRGAPPLSERVARGRDLAVSGVEGGIESRRQRLRRAGDVESKRGREGLGRHPLL
jgi:hypothetical protein